MLKFTKRWKVRLIGAAAIITMAATIPLAIWLTHTQGAQLENARRRCETGQHITHEVTIQNDQVKPAHTTAKLCDTLTITNLDPQERLLALGPHEHHISYDGVSERVLDQGQSLTVKLIRSGTFTFHDHEQDTVQGTFSVHQLKP